MKIYIERQNALVICKVKQTDRWLFTACYEGVTELLGQQFPPGAKFEVNFEATNIRRLDNGHETNINDILMRGGECCGEEESEKGKEGVQITYREE